MKKAMLAAAVMAAGAAMAVESGIVGYNNKTLRDSGNAITAQFLNIGSTEKFKLSDIKITGYEEDEVFKWSTYEGTFFCALTKGGGTDYSEGKYFTWSAEWDYDNDVFLPGKWVDFNSQPITPHGAGDVLLEPGQAVWLNISEGDGEHPQILIFPELKLN